MAKQTSRKLKILVVHTSNMNLGDTVLMDNDVFLLKKALKRRRIPYELFIQSISSRDTTQVKYADAMIFAGGILKDTTEKFWLWMPELLEEAETYGVPTFFSAIGAEPRTPDDPKGEALVHAVNLSCVKGISIRDDIETLRRDYLTSDSIEVTPVMDPALWCRDCYREVLPKGLNIRENAVIGLGIARSDLFADYGQPEVTEEIQMNFWLKTVALLEQYGFSWEIFTNGDPRDEAFAEKVFAAVGHGAKLPTPRDASELVKNISRYRGVIATRMHSNIIAYSLGIPGIGFIWNQKLRFFSDKIGHPERFLTAADMTPENAVNALKRALSERTRAGYFRKHGVYKAIYRFVKNYVKPRELPHSSDSPVRALIAPSLGNIEKRYDKTNSLEAFRYSLAHGYHNFEVNVRLTSDDRLVCTDSWSEELYRKMQLPNAEELGKAPLSYDEFKAAKTYGRFPTADLTEFLREVKSAGLPADYRIFLTIGKPAEAKLPMILTELTQAIQNSGFQPDKEHFIIRVENSASVKALKKSGIEATLCWHFATKEEDPEAITEALKKAVSYCAEQKLSLLSLRQDYFTPENAALLKDAGLLPCVFGSTKADRLAEHFKNGAFLISSRIYDAEYVDHLIK